MSKNFPELTKAQLLGISDVPKFPMASLRVLEGEGFSGYEAALNAATIVAYKGDNAAAMFNGIIGFAIEGRIKDYVGATHYDMEAALKSDFYIINNAEQTYVKCNGKNLSGMLKGAVVVDPQDLELKEQIGFAGIKDLVLKPITEYASENKFLRCFTDLHDNKHDDAQIARINELILYKFFDIESLFEFSKDVASARYFNIDSVTLASFEKEIAARKLNQSSGGFF